MQQESGFNLELDGETEEKLRNFAHKNGLTVDEAFEFIITQYLQRQLAVIKKRSEETGVPVNDLLELQFVKLLDFLNSSEQNRN